MPFDSTVVGSTGSARAQIPIELPPGPGGLVPHLALAYSSDAGDGPLGVGWEVPLGEIRCATRFGTPDYGSCPVYELDGELLLGPDAQGAYHTFVESFRRIRPIPYGADFAWEVTATDGTRFVYGGTADARVDGPAEPAGTATARWLLSEVRDVYDNAVVFTYDDHGDAGNRYPATISYGDGERLVAFFYESRPDPRRDYAGGIEQVTTRRLREIEVWSAGSVHQRLVLGYAPEGSAPTHRTRLASVQRFGADCPPHPQPLVGCSSLPPWTFDYTEPTATAWPHADGPWNWAPGSFDPGGAEVAFPEYGDVNGDGLVDVINAWCHGPVTAWPCASPDAAYADDASSFVWRSVHLNTGSGWESAPSEPWTSALQNLVWDAPTLKIEKTAGWDIDNYVCDAEVGSYPSGVFFNTRDEFGHDLDAEFLSPPVQNPTGSWTGEVGVDTSWRVVDLNGDGRVDLVASTRVGGVWQKAAAGCGPQLDPSEHVHHEAHRRVVFLNTGSGWQRAPKLEVEIPAFSAMEVSDTWGENCDFNGWWGVDLVFEMPDLCRQMLEFPARFLDLNGDGRLDLLAERPIDYRFLPYNGGGWSDPTCGDGANAAAGYDLCDNPMAAQAWIQAPDEAGDYTWVRAGAYDFVDPVDGRPLHTIHLDHVPYDLHWFHDDLATAFVSWDDGVRIADLNGDGLPDLTWRDPIAEAGAVHHGGPSEASGVLLNTGAGWCAVRPGSPCGDAISARLLPPVSLSGVGSQNPAVGAYDVWQIGGTYDFRDVNGDGLPELLRTGAVPDAFSENNHPYPSNWFGGTWPGSEAFSGTPGETPLTEGLYSPGSSPSPWIDAEGGVYRGGAGGRLDLDGDGIVDHLSYSGSQPSWLSILAHPDLLRRIDNGRGGTLEFTYVAEAEQRDDALEALAEANAPGAPGVARFTARPVVASVTVAGPNREAATTSFAYARSRWCPRFRSGLGFGLVRRTLPDGSWVDTHYHQRHGAAGRVFRRTAYEEVGGAVRTLHHLEETWEVLAAAELPPGAWAGDGSGALAGGPVHLGRLVARFQANEYGAAPGDDTGAATRQTFGYDDAYGFGFLSTVETVRASATVRTTSTPLPLDAASWDAWIVGLPETIEIEALDPDLLLRRTELGYDARGRIERTTADVHPRGDPSQWETQTSWIFRDTRGNVMRTRDPADRVTERCYDGNPGDLDWCDAPDGAGSLLVAERDPAGKITTYSPDPVFGTGGGADPEYTDAPATRTALDAFGRGVGRFVTPEGGDEIATSFTVHHDEAVPPWTEEMLWVDEAATESIRRVTVSDGLGGVWKEIEEVAPASPGGPLRHRCTARHHDPATRTTRATAPLASDALCGSIRGDVEHPATVTVADALGRPVRTTMPGGVSVVAYGVDDVTIVRAPGVFDTVRLDRVLAKNAKGDLEERGLDGDRVMVVRECENTLGAAATSLDGVACASPDTTRYGYQGDGAPEIAIDPLWNILRTHYDTRGRPIRIDDPDAGTSHSAYDAAGNVAWTRDARGLERSFTYDALDRITGVVTPADESDVAISYREGERGSSGEATDGYTTTLRYDAFGRLASKVAHNAGRTLTARREYDLLGRVTSLRHGGLGPAIRWEYAGAYLRRVCRGRTCDAPDATVYVEDIGYDAVGRRIRMTLPGGERAFAYESPVDPADDARRLVSDAFTGTGPEGFFTTRAYTAYDPLGNLLAWSESSAPEGLSTDGAFTYDGRNRLASWTRGGETESFGHDALGNLVLHRGEVQTFGQGGAPPHAIVSRPDGGGVSHYAYDAAGQVASVTGTGATPDRWLRFDSGGRLTCVGSSSGICDVLSVAYDASGRRIREVAGGVTRRFHGDAYVEIRDTTTGDVTHQLEIPAFGERIAMTELSQPGWVYDAAWVVNGREVSPRWLAVPPALAIAWLLALALRGGLLRGVARRPGTAGLAGLLVASVALAPAPVRAGGGGYTEFHRWILSDPLGSGVVVVDGEGALMRHTRFRPFGGVDDERAPGARAGRRVWAGHVAQEETGLVPMGARWMDPASGTFLSVDPITRTGRPQRLNAYAYAANNPVARVDPTGMESHPRPDRYDNWIGRGGSLIDISAGSFQTGTGSVCVGPSIAFASPSEFASWSADLVGGAGGEVAPGLATPTAGPEAIGVVPAIDSGGTRASGGFFSAIGSAIWRGIRSLGRIFAWDLGLATVGILGNVFGVAWGGLSIAWGVATLSLPMLRFGFHQLVWGLVPRYGFWSGPAWGLPSERIFGDWPGPFSSQNVIEEATFRHDRNARNPGADRALIRDVWSRHDLGPYGQVYRAGLTAGFSALILAGYDD